MYSNIKISGSIITELSEKIPSNIIALNELIKNSYDAGAKKVVVDFNTEKKLLVISDDGCGMNKYDIDVLFHISNSEKQYGKKNIYGRYTQGSKGLGFLSVFKFGKKVTWMTKKDNSQGLEFSVDYEELIKSSDLSKVTIDIKEDASIKPGTQIVIELDEYTINSLKLYLEDPSNREKILNSFEDEGFIIEIKLDDNMFSNIDKLALNTINKKNQLFYIKYNSKDQKVNYYYNDILIMSDQKYESSDDRYYIELELVVFQLQSGGKKDISQLYYNDVEDLTPLIYINKNLFNNYNLFNPNIMRRVRSKLVLGQIIGSVRIICDNPLLNFNSDRSQFLQNELTDNITKDIRELNKAIQTYGSKHKKYLFKFDEIIKEKKIVKEEPLDEEILRNNIKDDFCFKSKVKIERNGNKIKYSFANKEVFAELVDNNNESNEIKTAEILLTKNTDTIEIPSKQIELKKEYIKNAHNSNEKKIDLKDICITCDGTELPSGILNSIVNPCNKKINFIYDDKNTGKLVQELNLIFVRKNNEPNFTSHDKKLINFFAKEGYEYKIGATNENLIKQVNALDLSQNTEIISCAIRAIFELCLHYIKNSLKFKDIKWKQELIENIRIIIDFVKQNNSVLTTISESSNIGYNDLKNLVNDKDFEDINKTNLTAHKSTLYITTKDLEQLGKLVSIFILVTNELLNNPKIQYKK